MSPARHRAGPAADPALRPPIAPMLAAGVDEVPEGPGLAYEPKWDGWRALAFRTPDRVYLQSRAGRNLSTYFLDITRAVRAAIPPGVVLDGELVVWERERTNFALLQRRVTAGGQLLTFTRLHPAHYVVFDLLSPHQGGRCSMWRWPSAGPCWSTCSPELHPRSHCPRRPPTSSRPPNG